METIEINIDNYLTEEEKKEITEDHITTLEYLINNL